VHKIYFENGLLYSSAECRNFKKHGSYVPWSSQKIITCAANYDFDRLHGEYVTRWSDGTPKEVGKYYYDKKIGIYRWYRMDGSLWAEIDCGEPSERDELTAPDSPFS
jgi:antitoxin component YwqK of YwqJK toxin-antitoxin module